MLRLSILWLAASCASACSARSDRQPAASSPYAQGVAVANEEIRRGEASIYVAGLVATPGEDPETGLPYRSAGCVLSRDLADFMRGHNETIRAHFRRAAGRAGRR